jgi:hypothetical protein
VKKHGPCDVSVRERTFSYATHAVLKSPSRHAGRLARKKLGYRLVQLEFVHPVGIFWRRLAVFGIVNVELLPLVRNSFLVFRIPVPAGRLISLRTSTFLTPHLRITRYLPVPCCQPAHSLNLSSMHLRELTNFQSDRELLICRFFFVLFAEMPM